SSQVRASGSSQVTAYGSSQVTAYGSSQVTAYGSSQVTAYGSSQVTAYGSSQVTASDSSQVRAYGSSQVTASGLVAVTIHGTGTKVTGGVQIAVPAIATVEDWCDHYGLPVEGGFVTLFKAVRDDYSSSHGFQYMPGSVPEAPDWDGGKRECGGGLHFSPTPHHATGFDSSATRFLAVSVAVADIRAPQPDDAFPQKVKARRAAGPCIEVDINGKPL
ncbi:MAG TPA: hypothetical protein VGA97_03180, partial [Acidimicrobiia bacterium]